MDTYTDIWLMHPLLRGCADQVGKPLVENDAKTRLFTGLSGPNAEQYAYIFATQNNRKRMLRAKTDLLCGKENEDQTYCQSLLDIINLIDVFQTVKRESKTSVKWIAFQLYFVAVKENNPGLFDNDVYPSAQKANEIIVQNLKQIFKYMANSQMNELKELLTVVPGLKTIRPRCKNHWNLSNREKNSCLFWNSIVQIRAYLKSTSPPTHGRVRKVLNTKTDYREFLRLTEMDRVLQVVQDNANALPNLVEWVTTEVTKNTDERFRGLRTYFQKVESFNREKANADVGFTKGWVDEYKTDLGTISTDLGERINKILISAITAVTADIVEDTIKVGFAIAQMANPLEKIFGGMSFLDFMDATQQLGQSIAKIPELVTLYKTYNDLITKAGNIGLRFQNNANFLGIVKDLIDTIGTNPSDIDTFEDKKQTFLECYRDYSPKVKRPELTALTKTWEVLIDEACELISSTHGAGSAITKMYMGAEGHCPKAKVEAAKLIETYTEIYDFQFDLIEAMAANMRSITAQHAASEIVSDYEGLSNSDSDAITDFETLSLVSYISYKINIWQIAESYCAILEYKEGGRQPASVCKGTETEIASLASYVSPTCRDAEEFKDIPISSSSGNGFMDLSKLYAGRPVIFQIPDSDWLVTNKWISALERDSAIVVKKFEVFLPYEGNTQRRAYVKAEVIGDNKLSTSSSTSYVIVPNKKLIFEYLEGNHDQPCRSQTFDNPYGSSKPDLCPINVDENNCLELLQKTPLFPSVYSRWKITVSGYESTPVPEIANNDFKLKVGMKLCILNQSQSNDEKTQEEGHKGSSNKKSKVREQRRQKCVNNLYWSKKSGRCVRCPKGSRSALDGYYCKKVAKKGVNKP